MSKSLLTVFLAFFCLAAHAQTWEALGPDDHNRVSYNPGTKISLAQNNGISYVAFVDAATNRSWVRYYSNSNWKTLGGAISGYTSYAYPSISIHKDIPYVAVCDGFNNSRATLKKFNGTDWETVGSPISSGTASYTAVTFIGDFPYVAYQDLNNANKITVKKFNGSNWDHVGVAGISAGEAVDVSIVNDGLNLYVSYRDASDSYKVKVQKFSGTAWELTGSASLSDGGVYSPSITVTGSKEPCIVYVNSASQLIVKKYNGSVWQTLETANVGYYGNYSTITADGDILYVAYKEQVSNSKIVVKRYSGNTWEDVGSGPLQHPVGEGKYALVIENGNPILATPSSFIEVSKFDGTTWRAISEVGLVSYNYMAANPKIAITTSGTPLLAYSDPYNGDKLTVKQFDGTGWNAMGSVVSSFPYTNKFNFEIKGEVPYIAYSSSNTGYVYKFVGSEWQQVTSASYSSEFFSSFFNKFAFDGETPYVCYSGYSDNKKLTVKKFNGNSWELAGNSMFSGSVTEVVDIAVSKSVPYVVYSNSNDSHKAYVHRLNGTAWEIVGSGPVSSGYASECDIELINDVPYLLYRQSYVYYVVRFNGTSWQNVGSPLSTSFSSADARLIADNGVAYVSFIDGKSNTQLLVKKFNGTDWEIVGSDYVSSGSADNPSLAVRNNSYAVTYTSGGLFAKGANLQPLAIDLIDFKVDRLNEGARLSWKTSAENGSGLYLIEKSSDGQSFSKLAEVKTSNASGYSLMDYEMAAGITYYRLWYISASGEREVLGLRTLKAVLRLRKIMIYPNPVKNDKIKINISDANGIQKVKIYDVMGALVYEGLVVFLNGIGELAFPEKLLSGRYQLIVDGYDSGGLLIAR